jgi:hypothetical protein
LLPRDRVGIGRVSQGKHLISREVVYRRHGRQTIKFLVGGDVKGPGSAVAADHVIAALELAVGFEPFTLLGLLRDGVDHVGGKRATPKFHRTRNFIRHLHRGWKSDSAWYLLVRALSGTRKT